MTTTESAVVSTSTRISTIMDWSVMETTDADAGPKPAPTSTAKRTTAASLIISCDGNCHPGEQLLASIPLPTLLAAPP